MLKFYKIHNGFTNKAEIKECEKTFKVAFYLLKGNTWYLSQTKQYNKNQFDEKDIIFYLKNNFSYRTLEELKFWVENFNRNQIGLYVKLERKEQ